MLEEKLVIRKNYQKNDEISTTKYSKIYNGRNIIDGEPVIIEEYSSTFDFNFQMKFLHRIQLLSKVDYKSIVPFVGFCMPEEIDHVNYPPTVIFKYVNNVNLETLITKSTTLNGLQIMIILYGIASGLKFLNDKCSGHGNLDLRKIIINQNWEPLISDVGEFGDENDEAFSIFKAPEILTNNALERDEKVDVYSFGFIIYSVFCGFVVQQLNSTDVINGQRPQLPPIIPVQYQDLIKSCWDQNPDRRPSFDEIISKLSSVDFDLSNNGQYYKYYQAQFCSTEEIKSLLKQGENFYSGINVDKNERKAVKFFKKAAKLGNRCGQFRYGFCLLYGRGILADFEKAVKYLKKSSDQDYCHAHFYLGLCYKYGYGVEKNLSTAFFLFQRASTGPEHNLDAMVQLGKAYMKGEGVQKDQVRAAHFYYDAAQEGNAKAQRLFGLCWINGIGVEPNPNAGEEFVRKAANNGDLKAQDYFQPKPSNPQVPQQMYQTQEPPSSSDNGIQSNYSHSLQNNYATNTPPSSQNNYQTNSLNSMSNNYSNTPPSSVQNSYLVNPPNTIQNDYATNSPQNNEIPDNNSQVVPIDNMEKLEKAAESGDPAAQCKYGLCLLNGDGVPQDLIIGYEYILMASKAGNSDAWVALGNCYRDGLAGKKKDVKNAAAYYQRAASVGNPAGIENYGYFLDKGIGVKKNQKEALNQWEKLAKLNNPTGYYMLGLYYKNGIEVKKNHVLAFKYFKLAADLNHSQACLEYGIYLENGKGSIGQDLNQAKVMYEKAFDGGVQQAKDYIIKISKKLGNK